MARTSASILLSSLLLAACAVDAVPDSASRGPDGKADSGWLGSDTYELGGVLTGTVYQVASGEWASLEESEQLQIDLIDEQIRFAKNAAEDHGYRLNLLSDEVHALEVQQDGERIRIDFEVTVDLIATIPSGGVPGSAGDLETPRFDAEVPAEPIGIFARIGDACAKGDGSHEVSALNYAYYYDPSLPTCDVETVTTTVEVTEIFERSTVYPEYDRLLNDLDDGYRGFFAAIVPAQGDHDPMSRFEAHTRMLENDLGLTGQPLDDEAGLRYSWVDGQSVIVIDVYDPTAVSYTSSFRQALSQYQLILYNGHSNYGTMQLLSEPESFNPELYQIVMMHSCQSYAYYTRQVFRGKTTDADPHGWDTADVVATGRSSYPTGSPKTLEVLLESLMEGMVAIGDGRADEAPSWLDIIEGMNRVERGILYGAAGVRENRWQP
jgi:hypothetical protein